LLALLRVDPRFHALHQTILELDAEAARVGSVPAELSALKAGLEKGKAPTRALPAVDPLDAARATAEHLEVLRMGIGSMRKALRRLRQGGADAAALKALRAETAALDTEAEELRQALRDAGAGDAVEAPDAPPKKLLPLLEADRAHVRALRDQARDLRRELLDQADGLAQQGLEGLHDTLAAQLRRARIGRIDAVMGSKRRMELQVESLAGGRFPPELADPLRMQSLLRDDEEYWPFEGEDWPDEFVERYNDGDSQ